MSSNRHPSDSSSEEDSLFSSQTLDSFQFISRLLHTWQVLSGQLDEALETFCHEVTLASHGQAQLILLGKQRRRTHVPPSWHAFPVEANDREYGKLFFASDPVEPSQPVVSPFVARAAADLCALILNNIELTILSTGGYRTVGAPAQPTFTPREKEVLELLCRGQNLQAIADILHITSTIVNQYYRKICAKLGAQNEREVVFAAFAAGLFYPIEGLTPHVVS